MLSTRHHLAEEYFSGRFAYSPSIAAHISRERFNAIHQQFSSGYDDFYHAYFKKYGAVLDPNKALVRIAFSLFLDTYGHLPKAYKNCAISSGTLAHIDAVAKGYHTTDRLARAIGSDWHTKTIKDNSQRSLERIERIKDLFSEVFFIAPVMFEGSTRAFSKDQGRELTNLAFQAEEYMAFWNMVIDQCEAFVLDDVRLDMPTRERVRSEITNAQTGNGESLPRPLLQTSNWADSRNSFYEIGRAVYIALGLHPLRPDAKMDIRLYDQDTHKLYPARLIDIVKPIIQNILRFAPQGIETDSACTTVARLFNLHRMRTDEVYNQQQTAPIQLDTVNQTLAKPTLREIKEFNRLIELVEPYLLTHMAHTIKTEGLSPAYAQAKKAHPLNDAKPADIVAWQRKNIPLDDTLRLWDITQPETMAARKPCKVQKISHGEYIPQRRQHEFERGPFDSDPDEIWPDDPFKNLEPMYQKLAQANIGVLEIVVPNSDVPEYRGIRYDVKRGDAALNAAASKGLADLSLLPGALGKDFAQQVKNPAMDQARIRLDAARSMVDAKGRTKSVPVFGAPIIANLNDMVRQERHHFVGQGRISPPSDYRLCLDLTMLRRNYTVYEFQKNWETSEDGARAMMLATKMEFGLIKRPGGNDTEIKVVDEQGRIIPFADRVESLYTYLSILKQDERIKRAIATRDPDVTEGYGVRHISLTLARLLEIYDRLKDPEYNGGQFELRRVRHITDFARDLDRIHDFKNSAQNEIMREWCWLWDEADLKDLREDYRAAWLENHGRQASRAGRNPVYDEAIKPRFGTS